ncbi:cadherin-like protein 26 [Colossoma macropomum]|uniref:cadherin-like protein 26 n=1 Tax=Colossoma macropomum TaxID=42526 RepID=UPI001863B16C|nr:cadherin-like protein 26 [Colossoma macropomum]
MRKLTLALFLAVCICSVAVHSRIRQKRAWIIDSFNIEEENPGPFPYLLGTIELDKKYLVNFGLHGSGVDEEPKGVLTINKKNGQISVHKKVDYETFHLLKLTFEATNASNNKVDTRLGVEIKILDINDHAPVFSPPHQQATVNESTAQGRLVATVMATDRDDSQSPNGTFSFNIVSVTPKTDNVEFFLEPTGPSTTGRIFFRGCLDYEKAKKYTILVEAKDQGDKVQLSSTSSVTVNIIDKNNYPPEITGQTGPGRIKERDTGVEVLRLQVADKDSPGSQAWKAKYTIHGDKEKYFKIETDPKTNEGVLTVIKAMDYEEQTSRNVSISVANEVPYFSCEITGRPAKRLWDVKTFNEEPGKSLPDFPKLYPVTIAVEDVNDPPEFVPPVRKVGIMENTEPRTYLCTLEAKDPDKTFASKFRFSKGEDVDNWITVDPETGEVFTAKVLDRESPLLKDSSYSVILYVVDNGAPPMTGTGTLIIQVGDLNDNLPIIEVNTLGMCLSDEATTANITAVDLDLPPYSSPFTYELLGDVKGKWSIDPSVGTTVNLVKESTVHSGVHELQIKVSDTQGLSQTQNLSVTVCDCTSTPNCHLRRSSGAQVGSAAIGIMVFALLLLLAILLMAFMISCKHEKKMIMTDDEPGWRLLESNIETLGTDCKVPAKITQVDSTQTVKAKPTLISTYNGIPKHEVIQQNHQQAYYDSAFQKEQLLRRSLRRSSTRRSYRSYHSSMSQVKRNYSIYSVDDFHLRQNLLTQINQNLFQLQVPGEELGDYEPYCYAYEGEPMIDPQLDAISLPENDFNPDVLTNLDQRFNKLASICRPDLTS